MSYSNEPIWLFAYMANFFSLSVWPIAVMTIVAAIVLFSQAYSKRLRNKKKVYLSLAMIAFVIAAGMPFTGDYLDEIEYREACNTDEGLRIYQYIDLDSSLLIPYDPDSDPKGENSRYVYEDKGIQIDRAEFDNLYYITEEKLHDKRPLGSRYSLISRENNEVMSVYTSNRREPFFLSETPRRCYSMLAHPRSNEASSRLSRERNYQIQLTVNAGALEQNSD